MRAALVDGVRPAPRTAAAIALVSASGTLAQFHPDIPWSSTVYARGKGYEQGDWGAVAWASAVSGTMTAVVTSAVVAATT